MKISIVFSFDFGKERYTGLRNGSSIFA